MYYEQRQTHKNTKELSYGTGTKIAHTQYKGTINAVKTIHRQLIGIPTYVSINN